MRITDSGIEINSGRKLPDGMANDPSRRFVYDRHCGGKTLWVLLCSFRSAEIGVYVSGVLFDRKSYETSEYIPDLIELHRITEMQLVNGILSVHYERIYEGYFAGKWNGDYDRAVGLEKKVREYLTLNGETITDDMALCESYIFKLDEYNKFFL